MLQLGNDKLGRIHTFSLPPMTTCPGKTPLCAALCYAQRGFYTTPSVKNALNENYRHAQMPDFSAQMIAEIASKRVRILRVHVSGDYFSLKYTNQWYDIVRASPNTTFYAYTRSWCVAELQTALAKLAQLENMHLWYSADRDTESKFGPPPATPRTRVAFLVRNVGEPVPAYAHLTLRHARTSVEKYRDGVLVCPAENGIQYPNGHMQCARCRLCLTARKLPSKVTAPAQTVTIVDAPIVMEV